MKRTLIALCAISLCLAAASGFAKPWWMRGVESNETDFLSPDQAFRVGGHLDGSAVTVRFVIADGYYLYKSRMTFAAESPGLLLGTPQLPAGTPKNDPNFGPQEIYTQQVEVKVPFSRSDAGAHPVQLKVTYQGCAEAGLCYPPISKVIFPGSSGPAPAAANPPQHWEMVAIFSALAAFFIAGFALRKDRRLPLAP
jgi:thiol:disulfide interchange protein DsbD